MKSNIHVCAELTVLDCSERKCIVRKAVSKNYGFQKQVKISHYHNKLIKKAFSIYIFDNTYSYSLYLS